MSSVQAVFVRQTRGRVAIAGSGPRGGKGDPGADTGDVGSRADAMGVTIPAPAQLIRVHGYSTRGDTVPVDYRRVSAAPAHPGYFQDASGAFFEIVPPADMGVFPPWLGGVGDDRDADHVCVNNAAAVAAALGVPLWLGGTNLTWRVISDPGQSTAQHGLYFPALSVGNVVKIHGLGATIKRKAFTSTVKVVSARCLSMEAIAGCNYDISGIALDGNEQNCTFNGSTFAHLYEFEQCANMAWVGPTIQQLGNVRIVNIAMKNPVGDGLFMNTPADRLLIEGLVETGRTRRPRAGIQLGYIPKYTYIANCDVVAFESEPVANPPVGNLWVIDGLYVRSSFDVAGRDADNRINLKVYGLVMTREAGISNERFSVGYANARFTDCDSKGMPAVQGRNQILTSQVTFDGGSLEVAVNPSDATMAIPIMIAAQGTTDFVRFIGQGRFRAPAGITSTAAYVVPADYGGATYARTGCYLQASYNATTDGPLIEVDGWTTEGNLLPVPFNAQNCGRLILKGGRLRGTTAVVRQVSTTGFVSHVVIDDPMQWARSGDAACPMMLFAGSTGTGTFKLAGAWNGELMAPTADGTSPSITDWTVSATMLVDSTPQARIRGLPGLKAFKRSPATTQPVEWAFENGSTPGVNNKWSTIRTAA